MVDKFGKFYTRAESQYLGQRYYKGRIAHSVPIFMVLGNHDGLAMFNSMTVTLRELLKSK